jgi:hypothetical protein
MSRKRSHEPSRVAREVHRLERTADAGRSPWTPLILIGEVWVICAIAVLVLLAVALLAYRLAS